MVTNIDGTEHTYTTENRRRISSLRRGTSMHDISYILGESAYTLNSVIYCKSQRLGGKIC